MAISSMLWQRMVKTRLGTYREFKILDPILANGELVVVTNIPGWWRRRKTRIKIGDGVTRFSKLKYT